MKRVFVCSPLRPRDGRTLEQNQLLARQLCRWAVLQGVAPFAPHMFYTQFLDDAAPEDRERGMAAGRAFLAACDEIWVFVLYRISQGMREEIAEAGRLNIPLRLPECWENVR